MSMNEIEAGVQGAKRSTWDEHDPRPVVMRLIAKRPRASEEDLYEMFWAEIEDEKATLKAMARYWFHNTLLALRPRPRPAAYQAEVVAAKARAKAQLRERVQYEASLVLLDLLMPNDKTLGECTREDCARFGGWFAKLAAKVPPRKTVADVLTEQQVRKLWQTAKK